MRSFAVARGRLPLAVGACRWKSAFYELYGRAVNEVPDVETPMLQHQTDARDDSRQGEVQCATWLSAMEMFAGQQYAFPDQVDGAVSLETLRAIREHMEEPFNRRLGGTVLLWRHALEVYASVQRSLDTDTTIAATHCAVILYLSGQHAYARERAREAIHQIQEGRAVAARQHWMLASLLSVYIMCCGPLSASVDAALHRRAVEVVSTSRALCRTLEQNERHIVVTSVEVLLWSYDWVYRICPACGITSAQVEELGSHAPAWMENLFVVLPSTDLIRTCFSSTRSPPALLRLASEQAREQSKWKDLHALYQSATRRERDCKAMSIFGLSISIGEAMLAVPCGDVSAQLKVVQHIGSSAQPRLLVTSGRMPEGFTLVSMLLTGMQGPDAYYAMKEVLAHRDVSVARVMQEKHGDLLTGRRDHHWLSALEALYSSVQSGDASWRRELPTTLRLLSDAGKSKEFFRFVTEFDSREGRYNLCVAAALSQSMRQTKRWWHALEVVDLIASAQPPCMVEDGLFLRQACMLTLRTLHSCRRWEEALAVYRNIGSVVGEEAHRVLCAVVAIIPSQAPWRESLALLAQDHPVSPASLSAVLWARGIGSVPPSGPLQRLALRHLAAGGHWRPLLQHAQGKGSNEESWMAVLRAMDVASVDDFHADAFEALPVEYLTNRTLRALALRVALSHGQLGTLLRLLRKHGGSLSNEYADFVDYLRSGSTAQCRRPLADSYIIHRFTMFLTGADWGVRARAPSSLSSLQLSAFKTAASEALRIPRVCVGRRMGLPSSVFELRPIPRLSLLERHVLYFDGRVAIGFKVVGASIQAAARGLLASLHTTGCFSLCYMLPPNASGVFVLLEAQQPHNCIYLVLTLRMRVRPQHGQHTALLSTHFYRFYRMQVLDIESDGTVTVSATCVGHGVNLATASLREVVTDVASEGWGLVEREAGTGETFHVECVRAAFCCEPLVVEVSVQEPAPYAVGEENGTGETETSLC